MEHLHQSSLQYKIFLIDVTSENIQQNTIISKMYQKIMTLGYIKRYAIQIIHCSVLNQSYKKQITILENKILLNLELILKINTEQVLSNSLIIHENRTM